MTIERMSLASTTDPDDYQSGVITSGAGSLNALYTKYPGDKIYASQRPSIEITTDPSNAEESLERGRGIYYWSSVNSYYFVRDGNLYRDDYSNDLGILSTGKDKVFFAEVSEQLVIIDPSNNKGWFINRSNPSLPIQITDIDFPGNIPGKTLAGGAVSLDGFLFLLTTDGFIYNSNINAVDQWSGLDFVAADISLDGGVYIAKHHSHLCVIGTNSIQFYYNVGNPVGSPVEARQDVSYLTGAIDPNSVAENGDDVLFLGRASSGTIGLYQINGFKVAPVSNDSIDSFIGDSYNSRTLEGEDIKFILASSWFGNHLLCFLTSVASSGSSYSPLQTLVYDASNQLWTVFNTNTEQISKFEVVGSSNSTGSSFIKGTLQFLSGAVASINLTGDTTDKLISRGYFVNGYIDPEYFVESTESDGTRIDFNITTVETDFNSVTNKNQHRLSIVGTTTSKGQDDLPLEVSWTDNRYRSFSSPRDLETGFRRSLTRLGSFKRRAYSIDYKGLDKLRLEALEFDIRKSDYA